MQEGRGNLQRRAAAIALFLAAPAAAQDGGQTFALHGQATFLVQSNLPFRARFEGPDSLHSRGEIRETGDVTLYAGASPWRGGELWANPEIDQGFGLANTTGLAGFASGEAYKVGKANPYFRLQRLFFRQTIGLGGAEQKVEADLNQLGGTRSADRLVLTIGKFSVVDVFDANAYAHDPRFDFFNWSLIDAGALDYAADAWGYSTGASAELYRGRWALRAGLFNLSKVPNSEKLESGFSQYEAIGEVEERHQIGGHAGRLKLTFYFNHGNMARLGDALARARATGLAPDPAGVRRFATRAGGAVAFEQEIEGNLGVFARASLADGGYETFEFTDVDRGLSAGASLGGKSWGRADDRVGLGLFANFISTERKRFLDAGGLGILIGDGRLPRPGPEQGIEAWYDLALPHHFHVTADAQLVRNPGYDRDRGPVPVLAARLHAQF
jgi:high affinity Mn2+ porin